jgi:hypothetical protein
LSEADVREIRATYKGGYRNFKKLCEEYGLSSSGMRSPVLPLETLTSLLEECRNQTKIAASKPPQSQAQEP